MIHDTANSRVKIPLSYETTLLTKVHQVGITYEVTHSSRYHIHLAPTRNKIPLSYFHLEQGGNSHLHHIMMESSVDELNHNLSYSST